MLRMRAEEVRTISDSPRYSARAKRMMYQLANQYERLADQKENNNILRDQLACQRLDIVGQFLEMAHYRLI